MRQRGPGPAPAPAPADPVRAASVRAIAEQLSTLRGPLLPVLHEVVATHGYVTDDDVAGRRRGAQPLARRRARRRHLLPRLPPHSRRPHTGSRCAAPRPARRVGAEALYAAATRPLGRLGADVEVGEVFCLGNCALGPSGTVDGTPARPAVARAARRARRRGGADDRPVFVPCDAAAASVGADDVAAALAAAGVHGASATARAACSGSSRSSRSRPTRGRVGYGQRHRGRRRPRCSTRAARRHRPRSHRASSTSTRGCARQQRVTFARVGVVDPLDLADYEAHGGLAGLRARAGAVARPRSSPRSPTPACAAAAAPASPPASSGRPCSTAAADLKFVCCNADEGDSGTFADRMLMEGDPFTLIEGMTIAALRRRRDRGLRLPPLGVPRRRRARCAAPSTPPTRTACLGAATSSAAGLRFDLARAGRRRRLHLRRGDLDAREPRGQARRGARQAAAPRARGPVRPADRRQQRAHPRRACRWSSPTAATAYAALGIGRSRGTQVFQLAGNVARGGIVELPFGVTPAASSSRTTAAARRPAARCARSRSAARSAPTCRATGFDLPMDYEAFAEAGAMVGHGGIVVFDDTVDMARHGPLRDGVLRRGVVRQVHAVPHRLDPRRRGHRPDHRRDRRPRRATSCCSTTSARSMTDGSLCAMGGLTPMPVRSALEHFPEDFGRAGRRTGRSHAMTLHRRARLSRHPTAARRPCRATADRARSTIDGIQVDGARRHVGDARRRRWPASTVPKLCATDSLEAFGSCRLCLVEIDGAQGHPGVVHHPVHRRHGRSAPRPSRCEQLRRGVMELYLSDHPLRLRRLRANGDCELQDWPATVGLREVRYGLRRRDAPRPRRADDVSNPYFAFDPAACIVCSRCVRACDEVQGTFALTIDGPRLRLADHRRRHRLPRAPSASRAAPACRPARPPRCRRRRSSSSGMPTRSVITTCAYCGVGLLVQGRGAGSGDAPGSCGWCRTRTAAPTRATRASRAASPAATPPTATGSCAPMVRDSIDDEWRGRLVGRGHRAHRHRLPGHPGRARRRRDRRHHLVALHQRRGLRRPEDGAGGVRQQQRRHLRAGLPLPHRLRAQADVRHLGRHPGLRVGRAGRRHPASSAPTRPTPTRCSPRG